MGNFGDVREILQRPPTLESWESLIDALDAWYGREPLEVVLSYCEGHLSRWPADLPTFAPNSWFKREPALIAKNPITRFFEAAFLGRTTHWSQWAAAELEAQKPLKPPAFLSLETLGPLRWRGGESMDETQRKRFIVYLRSFKEIAPVELERVRQLLNDEDAQRWSQLIHEAWVDKGSPSAHRWAFFQLATLGNQDQIQFTTDSLSSMISEGRHVRAKQLMQMRAALGTCEAISDVANFAVFGSLSRVTRHYAIELIEELAKARELTLEDYIERRLTLQDQHIPADLAFWQDPLLPFERPDEDEPVHDEEAWNDPEQPPNTLAAWLERAMLTQRAFPWWMCRELVELFAQQPGLLWSVDDGAVVWMSEQGPVNLEGELVELNDDDLLRITHPATLKPKLRQQWLDALAKRQLIPPFTQLERPVYDKTNLVLTPDKPLHIDLSTLACCPEWVVFLSGHHINYSCFYVPGALWCALIPEVEYDEQNNDGEILITVAALKLVSILDIDHHEGRWASDAVAISETHYALARLIELDANNNSSVTS